MPSLSWAALIPHVFGKVVVPPIPLASSYLLIFLSVLSEDRCTGAGCDESSVAGLIIVNGHNMSDDAFHTIRAEGSGAMITSKLMGGDVALIQCTVQAPGNVQLLVPAPEATVATTRL